MSNIRKSFNFRDGVQVDDNIFIVRGALVGIGTSVPTERLDVRGTVSVSGLITAISNESQYSVVTGVSTANKIFVGITSINSGIITASSPSGIVTYYGDGGRLLNLPTSQWSDVDVGLGFTSIYANGYVGIATVDPRFIFQIAGNTDTSVSGFAKGVGLSSAGDAIFTGFVTAYSYVGFGTGITNLNASQLTDGTVNNSRLPETISIKDFIGLGITVSNAASIGSVYVTSGLVTSTSGIITYYGDGRNLTNLNASQITSGTLNNARLPSSMSVSGQITAGSGFVGNITGNVVGDVVGDVTGNITGTANTARFLTGTPNILVGFATAINSLNVGAALSAGGSLTAGGALSIGGTALISKALFINEFLVANGNLYSAGFGTIVQSLHVGSGVTINSTGNIGLGTFNPQADIEIVKASNSTISVVSNSGQARIAIGQQAGIGNASSVLRFGNTPRTLDIINYDYGSFNHYLHSGSDVGVNTGSFNWIYGKTNTNLMSLTYRGRLGIGRTNPTETFEVVGTSTVTGNAFVGSDLSVSGTLTFGVGSRITLGDSAVSSVIPNLNLNNAAGVTTLSQLHVSGVGTVGINTTRPCTGFDAGRVTGIVQKLGVGTANVQYLDDALTVFGSGTYTDSVAIGTATVYTDPDPNLDPGNLQVFNATSKFYNSVLIFSGLGFIGINTETPEAAIDLSRARGVLGERTTFLPPKLTTTERNAMTGVPEGAIIYNSTVKRLQMFLETGWVGFATVAG